ncbi:segregation and condensation protein A [Macrococcus armenti]|uniref:Segregation and condensation protein A n=1 Tax=Macrococcus armenti TaxID=2875764 RepID=A0ABY3ZS09_9STAP|nr:segregation/condensation protein A [Macrococcus armenti]UOB19684.1 segregation/condensation protein A [Macrococcus armenti]
MYEVKLASFEGPLDLLLHLIKKYEIDIYDISMKILTEQYINYIKEIPDLDINVHGEYLVMASELLRIKSRMLLPESPVQYEEDEDPREELMKQLIEYQNYRLYADILYERKQEEDKFFVKRANDLSNFEVSDVPLQLDIMDLITAYNKAKNRHKLIRPEINVTRDHYSIEEATHTIKQQLKHKDMITFDDFVTYSETKTQLITIFMAILELMKSEVITLHQEKMFGEILIERGTQFDIEQT